MRDRILFLAHLPPFAGAGGGQLRSLATLAVLAERFTVTLVTFQRPGMDLSALTALEPYCHGGIHAVLLPRGRFRDGWLAVSGWFSPIPWRIARDDSEAMRSLVASLVAREQPPAIHVDHLPMARFLPPGSVRTFTRVVLDLHNAEHRLFTSMLPFVPAWASPLLRRDVSRLTAFSKAAVAGADAVAVLTPEDREAILALNGSVSPSVFTIPVGIEVPKSTVSVPRHGPWRLATVATLDWLPNTDGLEWFATQVWPQLRRRHPDLVWDIAGVRANRRALRLGRIDGIRVHGAVPSVGEFLEGAAVFVAPVRCGAGIRIKVLDAMAWGLPVVTTPEGAEGIAPQCPCVVAVSPDAWSDAVCGLLNRPDERARLSREGRVSVERWHGRAASRTAWNRLYDTVLGSGNAST